MDVPGDLLRTPHPDNLAFKLFENLLPIETATGFSVALATLANSLVFFGSLFVAYHVIVGIVASASSGRVLGEKYHQVWAPVRVIILGFAPLVAVSATGLSGIHHIERLAGQIGTNLGDNAALAAVEHVVKDGHTLTPISAGGRQLAWDVAASEVCHAVYTAARQHSADLSRDRSTGSQQPPAPGKEIIKPARESWLPGWLGGRDEPARIEGLVWDYGQACGNLSFSYPSAEEFGSFGDDRRQAMAALVEAVRALAPGDGLAEHVKKGVREYDPADLEKLGDYIDHLAVSGVLVPELVARLNGLGDQFDAAVAASAARIGAEENREQRQQIVEGVKTHGWVLLGSYYRMLSSISEKSASYAAERATRRAPDANAWGGYSDQVAVALAVLEAQRQTESNRLILSGDTLADVADEASILATVTNSISEPVLAYLTGYNGWRQDPVGDMINSGNRMLAGAQTGFLAGLGATGIASASSTISQAPMRIVEFAMVPGWWLIGAAFVAGALLSYVLPLIPYVFMIFAIGALAMEVLVFAVAGLIWCFAHIRMDGSDLIGEAQRFGYHALFSLILRQPITVLGFLGAHAISVVLLNTFLMTWNFAFQGSQGGASIGITGILIAYGMMFFIQWHIYLRLFGLILEMPQRVAQYLGANIPGWHDDQHGTAVIAGASTQISAQKPTAPPTGKKGPTDPTGGGGKGSPGGVKARK